MTGVFFDFNTFSLRVKDSITSVIRIDQFMFYF